MVISRTPDPHIYIYMYIRMCICVCMYVRVHENAREFQRTTLRVPRLLSSREVHSNFITHRGTISIMKYFGEHFGPPSELHFGYNRDKSGAYTPERDTRSRNGKCDRRTLAYPRVTSSDPPSSFVSFSPSLLVSLRFHPSLPLCTNRRGNAPPSLVVYNSTACCRRKFQ